jgi:UDP:flavonoid glycosyltransferase YjiC (YdhE family)
MCSLGAATLHDRGGPVYATLGINPLVTADPEIPPFGSHRAPASSSLGRARNRLAHAMVRMFMRKPTALFNSVRSDLGIAPLPPGKDMSDCLRSPFLHIMPTTEAFEYPRRNLEPQIHFVGPLLPAPLSRFEVPDWWKDLAGKRVVHVTQGTVATNPDALVRPTIEALASEEVLLVVTSPDHAALAPWPANVRTAKFIPHSELLPLVDTMVTNGGYNGVLAALAQGVPLVCAGLSEDKANVTARVSWTRAGIDLRTDRPSPKQLRDAIRRVLDDPAYRLNATRIRDDFARHRPAAEAVALLERLAESQAPVLRGNPAQSSEGTGGTKRGNRPSETLADVTSTNQGIRGPDNRVHR